MGGRDGSGASGGDRHPPDRTGRETALERRPAPAAAAVGALPASLFGIPFTAFAAFWIWGAAQATAGADDPGAFFPLFGLPFLLIGLGIVATPLWAMLRARVTVYAVTDRRALVIIGGGTGGVSSHARSDIRDLMRVERADGSGSVFFAWQSRVSSRGFERRSRVGFIGIPEVRRVERLIREQILERAA